MQVKMDASTSTVILAGGLGTRMGGAKGMRCLHERALIDWVISVMQQQSDEVLISVHTHDAGYEREGCHLIVDQESDWAGPLAGLQSALRNARHDWVATVPCDTPFLPDNLIAHLHSAITPLTKVAVAVVDDQRQPAIALYQRQVLSELEAYLAAGGRKVNTWLDSLCLVEVPFDNTAAFTNINSSQELLRANQILHAGGSYRDVQNALA